MRAEDLQEVILDRLKADKRCYIRRTHRRAKVVTPNRSKFWTVLECDSRSQEPQIRVYDKDWADLKACELSNWSLSDWLAKILGLPLGPPVPAGSIAPNPDGGE